MLRTDPGFSSPDDAYELLVEAHRDLTAGESRLVNAKLILLLSNHIGDLEVLAEAIREARKGLAPKAGSDGSAA